MAPSELQQQFAGKFRAGMGAEAIKELLKRVDVEVLSGEMREKMKVDASQQKRIKFAKTAPVFSPWPPPAEAHTPLGFNSGENVFLSAEAWTRRVRQRPSSRAGMSRHCKWNSKSAAGVRRIKSLDILRMGHGFPRSWRIALFSTPKPIRRLSQVVTL